MTTKKRTSSPWLLWLPIGIGVFFVAAAVLSNVEYAISNSLYAIDTSPQIITGTLKLRIRYPAQLRLPLANESGRRPLTAWISDAYAAGASGPYTVTFTAPAAIAFKDSQGVEKSPRLILSAEGETSTPQVIFLETSPLAAALPSTVTLIPHVHGPDGVEFSTFEPLAIRLESVSELRMRSILTTFLGLIASVLVVTTLIYNFLVRREDRAGKEQRDQIAAIQKLLATDSLKALHDWVDTERRAQDHHWDESQQVELQHIRAQLLTRQTDLLWQVNQLSQAEGIPSEEIAGHLAALIVLVQSEPMAQRLADIRPIFAARPDNNPVDGTQAIDAAAWLWQRHDELTRALVVAVFVWVSQKHSSLLDLQVKTTFQANRKLRRLVSDPYLKHWTIIQQFSTLEYAWPKPLEIAPMNRANAKDFLNKAGFSNNPFWSGAAQFDSLLYASYVPPRDWDKIRSARPSLLISREAQDRTSVKLLIPSKTEQIGSSQIFPIGCELTSPFGVAHRPKSAYLYLIAKSCAQAWLEFIPLNAGVWFDLTRQQQHSLVDLMSWHAQSNRRPIDLLHLNGLTDDAEAKRVKEEVAERMANVTFTNHPSGVELRRWLTLRPPGLDYTFALIDCPFKTTAMIHTALRDLPDLSESLLESNVILKAFAAEPISIEAAASIETSVIEWIDKNLMSMLDKRIQLTRAPDRSYAAFADLFFPDPRASEAAPLLVKAAHGSLGKLQQLGQHVIDAHVAANATEWDFDILHDAL
jgi:hypothetical protein